MSKYKVNRYREFSLQNYSGSMLILLLLVKTMPTLHLIYVLQDLLALKMSTELLAKKFKMKNIISFLLITVNLVQALHLESELI